MRTMHSIMTEERVNSERCNRDLEEVNALVDLSSGLVLLVQINETDRINNLKEPIPCYLFLRKCKSSYLVTYVKLFSQLMFAITGSCFHVNQYRIIMHGTLNTRGQLG